MERQEARLLLKKYRERSCTPEELALLESWYAKTDIEGIPDLSAADWSAIQATDPPGFKTKIIIWKRVAIAASLLIGLGIAFYQYSNNNSPMPAIAKQVISPGGNKAFLILSNGRQINLADANNGELFKQAGLSISKTKSGQVVYTVTDQKAVSGLNQNTISTPNGGQWQVNLPDGSVVYLNAASSITYPVSFASAQKRMVKLSGEAYFEVAKDKAHPFVVETDQQSVEVLGTHFNINSYANEPVVKTTLLEGSVKVVPVNAFGVVLKPGEQAVRSGKNLNVAKVDLEEVMAWKNGYFLFNDEGIESIMNKIARWYDVDIEYGTTATAEKFNGMVSRNKKLEQILKILEETNAVKFKIEGRKVTVTK